MARGVLVLERWLWCNKHERKISQEWSDQMGWCLLVQLRVPNEASGNENQTELISLD